MAVLATHPPFLPCTSPGGQAQGGFLQTGTGCRRSLCTGSGGLGAGSLQGPSLQTGRRRSDSGAFRSGSRAAGTWPIRGEETILPSVAGSFGSGLMRAGAGSDGRAAGGDAAGSETGDGAATWLLGKLEPLDDDGLLDGDGLLGALL